MPTVTEAVAAVVRPVKQPAPETHADRAKRFLASGAWRRLRYTVLRANALKNGGSTRCELCGSAAAPAHIDHIEPKSRNWDRRLDPTNLQVLCEACNLGKSNRDSIDWRPKLVVNNEAA